MNNFCVCENCKHYIPASGQSCGVCGEPDVGNTWVYSKHDACSYFSRKGVTATKVKPRRLCDFCERRRPIEDDYGRYTMELTRLIPLSSINLTTGEKTEPKNKAEYAMFLYEDKDDGEAGSFPIKFCPLCGRKLTGEGKK